MGKNKLKILSVKDFIKNDKVKNRKDTAPPISTEKNPSLKEFLIRHKLQRNLIFDAKGKKISFIENEMRNRGAIYAFNTEPCMRGGHTFRDRKNHCLICKPSNIAFQSRHSSDGFIYIAGSFQRKLIKVGVAKNIKNRELSLNKDFYANSNDWRILFSFYTQNMGQLEMKVQNELEKHRTSIPYFKDNKPILSHETFFCSFSRAYSTMMKVIKENDIQIEAATLKDHYISLYEFPNRKRI